MTEKDKQDILRAIKTWLDHSDSKQPLFNTLFEAYEKLENSEIIEKSEIQEAAREKVIQAVQIFVHDLATGTILASPKHPLAELVDRIRNLNLDDDLDDD